MYSRSLTSLGPREMVNKNKNKNKKRNAVAGQGAYLPPTVTREIQRALENTRPRKATGTWQNTAARTLGGLLGGIAGPVGGALGNSAGGALARWLGYGKYRVTKNSIMERVERNVPSMHSANEATIIRHREYIGDVTTSSNAGSFSVNSYYLNPGLNETFPWLSNVAAQYQEYVFKGMVFEFVSTSADALNSTNTALGSVMMATQYRSTAPAFASKFAMNNEYFSTDAKPSENFCHPIECDPRENPYKIQYVRVVEVPAGEDGKTYDLGQFSIATTGFQAASVNVGELWVSYEVELRKPAIPSIVGLAVPSCHAKMNSYTNAAPLNGYGETFDSIGMSRSSNTLSFPINQTPGSYLVIWQWTGNATTCVSPTFTGTGCTLLQVWKNDTVTFVDNSAVALTTTYIVAQLWSMTPTSGIAPTIAVGAAGTLPASGSTADVFITAINAGLTS